MGIQEILDDVDDHDEVKMTTDSAAIRSSYKVFMESIAGQDFLAHLVTLEASSQGEGIKSGSVEAKAFAMERIGVLYNLRTYLADMSKPAPSQSTRVGSE